MEAFADIDEGVGLELGELTISEGSSPDLSLSVDALDFQKDQEIVLVEKI